MFDPDIKDRIRTTVEGQSGKRTLTYLVIPRTEGSFDIALPDMAYFDYAKKRFERLSVPPVTLDIESGAEEQGPAFGSTAVGRPSDAGRAVHRTTRIAPTDAALLRGAAPPRNVGPASGGASALGMWRRDGAGGADPCPRARSGPANSSGVLAAAGKGEVGLDELGAAVRAFCRLASTFRGARRTAHYESA